MTVSMPPCHSGAGKTACRLKGEHGFIPTRFDNFTTSGSRQPSLSLFYFVKVVRCRCRSGGINKGGEFTLTRITIRQLVPNEEIS